MKTSSTYVVAALGLAVVAVIGYAVLGRRPQEATIVKPAGGGGTTALLPFGNPGTGAPADFSSGGGTSVTPPTGAQAGAGSTPKPAAPSSPTANPDADLSWIFSDPVQALKAGMGNVQRTAQGVLQVTAPNAAITLKNFGTIYGSSQEAVKAGTGTIYQEKGAYYVAAPGAPVKLSDRFKPDFASLDFSSYGSVQGVVRGWTLVQDRLGNLTAAPAHSVPGSTYAGNATGAPPTDSEWTALAGARGSLQAATLN